MSLTDFFYSWLVNFNLFYENKPPEVIDIRLRKIEIFYLSENNFLYHLLDLQGNSNIF